jgi:hypothetical protein
MLYLNTRGVFKMQPTEGNFVQFFTTFKSMQLDS